MASCTHMAKFPIQLHAMLTALELSGQAHVAGFQPHGRAFRIHKTKQFVTEVLPRWFNQTHFSSFQRQLNAYGFKRITRGPDKDAYYHERFLRGQPILTRRIERRMRKGALPKESRDPCDEPDFYAMSFMELTQQSMRRCAPDSTSTSRALPAAQTAGLGRANSFIPDRRVLAHQNMPVSYSHQPTTNTVALSNLPREVKTSRWLNTYLQGSAQTQMQSDTSQPRRVNGADWSKLLVLSKLAAGNKDLPLRTQSEGSTQIASPASLHLVHSSTSAGRTNVESKSFVGSDVCQPSWPFRSHQLPFQSLIPTSNASIQVPRPLLPETAPAPLLTLLSSEESTASWLALAAVERFKRQQMQQDGHYIHLANDL